MQPRKLSGLPDYVKEKSLKLYPRYFFLFYFANFVLYQTGLFGLKQLKRNYLAANIHLALATFGGQQYYHVMLR